MRTPQEKKKMQKKMGVYMLVSYMQGNSQGAECVNQDLYKECYAGACTKFGIPDDYYPATIDINQYSRQEVAEKIISLAQDEQLKMLVIHSTRVLRFPGKLLVDLLHTLYEKNIPICSATEPLDSRTAMGECQLNLLAAFAALEHAYSSKSSRELRYEANRIAKLENAFEDAKQAVVDISDA